jgi:NADPH:quinone reductase-like Zn-dependent oxidoreductase
MDWGIARSPEAAARFGISLPSGFGYDFAGVVDEAGPGAKHAVGDRVYGGALGRAVADFVVVRAGDHLFPTPDGLSDEVASTLPVAASSAAAALAAVGVRAGDALLIGGAGGGVGIFAVQLAKLAGATVLGTASESTFPFLRELGAEPVAYGPGLAGRVQKITAAIDLFGTETAEAALALGVPPERIATIAAGPNPPGGVRATGGIDAEPGAVERVADAVAAGRLTVPVAAVFPVEKIRDAVALQATRHVHGKVVVTL